MSEVALRPAGQFDRDDDVLGVAADRRRPPVRYLVAAICVATIAVMLLPLVLAFLASIKTPEDAMSVPPHYLPGTLSLRNYVNFYFYSAGLPTYMTNSVLVAAVAIGVCLTLSVTAGYGLARYPIPFRETIFLLILAGMMLPYQALLTPLYLMFADLGLNQTIFGLGLIHAALQLPFSVFLMRTSFAAIPRELEEAAVMDGCGPLRVFFSVGLPAVVPAIVTVILFAFIASWNEFIAALIFMNKETAFTIPVMVVTSRTGNYGIVDWGMLQAGVVVSILPCILVYVFLQKYYVSGFLSGAIK